MAKKEMLVCDLCGKVKSEIKNSVTLNGVEYKEVCGDCSKKIDNLFNRIKNPAKRIKKSK